MLSGCDSLHFLSSLLGALRETYYTTFIPGNYWPVVQNLPLISRRSENFCWHSLHAVHLPCVGLVPPCCLPLLCSLVSIFGGALSVPYSDYVVKDTRHVPRSFSWIRPDPKDHMVNRMESRMAWTCRLLVIG
jgi:hypothetical protein